MVESTLVFDDPPPLPHIEFDSGLSIPPLDDTFFSQFMFNDDYSGDRQNDDVLMDELDLDFSFDDLCPPSSDGLILSDPPQNPNQFENSYSIDKGNDQFKDSPLIDEGSDQFGPDFKSACQELLHVTGESDFPSYQSSNESGGVNLVSPELKPNHVSGYLNMQSPESNGSNRGSSKNSVGEAKGLGSHSPESQISGDSDESRNSKNFAGSVSSSLNFNNNVIRDGDNNLNDKLEKPGNNNAKSSVLKRKKESNELINNTLESRLNKSRKSDYNTENKNNNCELTEEDEKRKARLIRNRESAQLSRQRKKHYVDELEDKVKAMHSTIQDLNAKISYFMAENVTLRQQMASGKANGGAVPPPPGAPPLPYPGVMYPWMPYPPPYMMKPHGSQVPLVPIPRLKTQKQAQEPKARKAESKKNDMSKTKKVAGISFLGLLFFIMLFGGFIPMVNMMYRGAREAFSSGEISVGSGFYENHRERLLMGNGTGFDVGRKDFSGNSGKKGQGFGQDPGSDEFPHLGNGSEPLVASLYVPRNDKLVKIDGNLIIHSILASEKAGTSKRGGENGLAVRGDLVPAIPVPGPRALGSGSADKEKLKSKGTDGSLQQWFREGLAGPMLSSGICTEVFQFDISPSSIVPTSRNVSQINNSSHVIKGRNRRILKGLPIPLPINISKETNSTKENLNVNNSSVSSMVVSVLVDPREAGDAEVDGVMGPKSLSRIFVVVLIDSVKYVTYSCMLPFKGASSHLITT